MSALRQEFIGRCQLKGLAKKTIITYTHAVASRSRFLKRSPLECSTADIRKFCLHQVNYRKISPRTVNGEIMALRTFFTLMLFPPASSASDTMASSAIEAVCKSSMHAEKPWE